MAVFCFIMALYSTAARAEGVYPTPSSNYGTEAPSAAFPRHFLVSYAVTALSYTFFTQVAKWDPVEAFIFSAVLTGMVGVVFEASEAKGPKDNLGQSMLYNAAGVAAAGATFVVFRW